jgi:hypothetical protein
MCTWSGKTVELLQAVTHSMLVSCIVNTVPFTKRSVVLKHYIYMLANTSRENLQHYAFVQPATVEL